MADLFHGLSASLQNRTKCFRAMLLLEDGRCTKAIGSRNQSRKIKVSKSMAILLRERILNICERMLDKRISMMARRDVNKKGRKARRSTYPYVTSWVWLSSAAGVSSRGRCVSGGRILQRMFPFHPRLEMSAIPIPVRPPGSNSAGH